MMMISNINEDRHSSSNNNNNANDVRPHQEDETNHNVNNDDNETGSSSATTRFTIIIEGDVNPVVGNLNNYHEILNEMFLTDRELDTVYALFGLQRIQPPKIPEDVHPSVSCLDTKGEDSIKKDTIEKTSTENVVEKLANTAATNPDGDDDETRIRQRQHRRDEPQNSDDAQVPPLPNVITKGTFVDLETFTQIASGPDRSRMLSDYLWKNMLHRVPQLSLWYRINGEYKLSARASEKDGGPGAFFRIRKYHLKTGSPKQSILDVFMSLSDRYEIGISKAVKQQTADHDKNGKSASEKKVTSYEILTSLDPDRNNEILEIISWKNESSYIQMTMDLDSSSSAKTQTQQQKHKSTCSSSTSSVGQSLSRCTISIKNTNDNGKGNQYKETNLITDHSTNKRYSLLSYAAKIDKMVKYYCDSLDESFWSRAPNGFHVPIKITGQKEKKS